ncbi:MAG: hypothetical protein BAJALOKI1v1_1180015 [Promethearchaeota archaeon]|nr:MAG: hypothetical protein BAJALOKI1v1_1180015 [Candidatus Lokiarchaeota archaeon]
MVENKTEKSNIDVFLEEFLPPFNLTREEGELVLRRFYQENYQKLRKFVTPFPEARNIVQLSIIKSFKTSLATTPAFMREAIEAWLNWAEIDDLPFDLITFDEDFTTCKRNLDYYKDICKKIGLKPPRPKGRGFPRVH